MVSPKIFELCPEYLMNVRGGDGTNETTTTTTSSDDKKTTRNPQTGKEIRIPA